MGDLDFSQAKYRVVHRLYDASLRFPPAYNHLVSRCLGQQERVEENFVKPLLIFGLVGEDGRIVDAVREMITLLATDYLPTPSGYIC